MVNNAPRLHKVSCSRNRLAVVCHCLPVSKQNLSHKRLSLNRRKEPHPLISRSCIFQTKGHHLVMIVSSGSNKSCLFLIVQGQWYLVISLKGIQETHPRMAYRCINQLIYLRHRKRVFGTSLIKICEVHTHMPFPSFLFHYRHIC